MRRIYGTPALPPQVPMALSLFGLALVLSFLLPSHGSAQAESIPARTKGRAGALITMYEMSDFQCPFCRNFALETMPALDREYIQTGKLRLTFINFPLTSVHTNAMAAAEVAMCAARQGKFWPVHDRLFRRQEQWAKRENPGSYFLALTDSAGADRATLAACVTSRATQRAVEADIAAARRAGARSTPTFYLEGNLIDGAAPLQVFREILDSIYRSKTATAP